MPVTGLRGRQILDGDVFRNDLNITTSGSAVIRRIIAGTNITISSTGVDTGTGDVTINATGGSSQWTTSGSDIYYTTGNVSIGTTTLDAKLRVAGVFNGTQAIFGFTDGRGLQVSTTTVGGTNEAGVILNARSSVTSGELIFQTDGVERVRYNSSGNVGINTNAPVNYGTSWRALEIKGAATTVGGAIRLSSSDASLLLDMFVSGGLATIQTASNIPIVIGTNGTERFRAATTGRITFANYTTTTSFTGTVVGYLAFDSSGNILTTAAPSGSSQWITSGSDIYYNTGNVGVGVTAPLSPIHILRASGTPTTIRWEQTGQRTYAMGLLGTNTALAIQDVTGSQTRWQLLSTGQFIFSAYTAFNSFSNTDAQGILGFDTSGNIVSMAPPIYRHEFVTDPVTTNNIPANVAFFAGSNAYVTKMDLTGKKRGRLLARVTTAANSTGVLRVRYRTAFSTTVSDYLQMGSSEIQVSINATGFVDSGWINLVAGAKADVFIALQTISGDGAADPVIAQITFETEE